MKAAVLLHETGKDSLYIKLRLHWLSEVFQLYLRNTKKICQYHNAALKYVNNNVLQALVLSWINVLEDVVQDKGVTNIELNLDDEDWEAVIQTLHFFLV